MKLFRSADEKQRSAAAEAAFRQVVGALREADPAAARVLAGKLIQEEFAALTQHDRRKLGEQAFVQYANNALADDHLTEDEEAALSMVAGAIGFTSEDWLRHDLFTRLVVAKLNNGRLPIVETPTLLPKRGEIVHLETAAALLKEVTVREWRGGSRGFSFRVAKGVRYHVAASRGQMVTVGTQVQIADTGILAVSNQRAAFLGTRKTIDMPFGKIIAMQLFADGVCFSLSNRQNAPILRVTMNTDVLGATLNAAMQSSVA